MVIYKDFLRELYGDKLISRNRLCLTDNDESEWGPLDAVIQTVPCWNGSIHMLCMFHALTLVFFETIYLKLPHRGKGKNRKLTLLGRSYGTFLIVYVIDFLFCLHPFSIAVTSILCLHPILRQQYSHLYHVYPQYTFVYIQYTFTSN